MYLYLHLYSSWWFNSDHKSKCEDIVLIWNGEKWSRYRIQALAKGVGKFACGEWETREADVFYKNVLVGNGGMRWGGGQGCGPSYKGRDSYMHLQRIHPTVMITVCS